jgi:uncharacterized RDD family membrane protein YckC
MFHIGQTGFFEETNNGQTEIYAGSRPVLLIWTAVAIMLFAALMIVRKNTLVVGIPTLKRRAVAFLIDFWFSVAILANVTALLPLWLEARRTGRFSWHFERDYAVGTDDLLTPLVLFAMALMFLYFVLPLTRGSQTVGCFIMRLKVTPPFGDEGRFTFREALRRNGYGLWGLMTGKWSRQDFRDGQGRTWWDRETNSRVALVKYE